MNQGRSFKQRIRLVFVAVQVAILSTLFASSVAGATAVCADAFKALPTAHPELANVRRWIHEQTDLIPDFLWVNETLTKERIQDLSSLPKAVRKAALSEIRDALAAHDAKTDGEALDHLGQMRAKDRIRGLQFLQQILVHAELKSALAALDRSRSTETLNFAPLEAVLTGLRRRPGAYRIADVARVAKAIQQSLRSELEPGDFVQLFGSFPNLAARIGSSDIDLLFSERLDRIAFSIQGGSLNDGSFVKPASKSSEATSLARTLRETEDIAREALLSRQKPGELISVTTLPRTYRHGMAVVEADLPELMSIMTLVSPVTVIISRDRVVLRIYDGLSSSTPTNPNIHEFPL